MAVQDAHEAASLAQLLGAVGTEEVSEERVVALLETLKAGAGRGGASGVLSAVAGALKLAGSSANAAMRGMRPRLPGPAREGGAEGESRAFVRGLSQARRRRVRCG
jgi:hypothetical protein